MPLTEVDHRHMHRALRMAMRGQGFVEPNPMVGCVIARGEDVLAEGWHQEFGGPHAELNALANLDSAEDLTKVTLYVTLEPCSHHGKTPPCADAVAKAGIRRVVIALVDPNPQVTNHGIAKLRDSGVEVVVGLLESAALAIIAPYQKRLKTGRPWVLAKWAMTLDGKLATHTGSSQWITNEKARAAAHSVRGRVDAILVGRQTLLQDDPALTARPPGPRIATRVVLAADAAIPTTCQLVTTARSVPTMVVVGPTAPSAACRSLEEAGCNIVVCPSPSPNVRLEQLLTELGSREMTNVLVEGGGQVLGAFFDQKLVDEVHAFIAPKVIGGSEATPAIGGQGISLMDDAWRVEHPIVELLDDNVYLHGRIGRR